MLVGIIAQRRKRERIRRAKQLLLITAAAAVLGLAAASQDLREIVRENAAKLRTAQVFAGEAKSAQKEIVLPQQRIWALQLGVFDRGERAEQETKRLQEAGVRCIIWQRERMRIVCSAALSRETLQTDRAKGQDAYVISEMLPRVEIRLTAQERALEDVQRLLLMPDMLFAQILNEPEEQLETIVRNAGKAAEAAVSAHPENLLYTQLAQSLVNWCALMEGIMLEDGAQDARSYAAVTMCTLCRELRMTLIEQDG